MFFDKLQLGDGTLISWFRVIIASDSYWVKAKINQIKIVLNQSLKLILIDNLAKISKFRYLVIYCTYWTRKVYGLQNFDFILISMGLQTLTHPSGLRIRTELQFFLQFYMQKIKFLWPCRGVDLGRKYPQIWPYLFILEVLGGYILFIVIFQAYNTIKITFKEKNPQEIQLQKWSYVHKLMTTGIILYNTYILYTYMDVRVGR